MNFNPDLHEIGYKPEERCLAGCGLFYSCSRAASNAVGFILQKIKECSSASSQERQALPVTHRKTDYVSPEQSQPYAERWGIKELNSPCNDAVWLYLPENMKSGPDNPLL